MYTPVKIVLIAILMQHPRLSQSTLGIIGGDDVIDFTTYGNTVQLNIYDPDTTQIRGYCGGSIIHPSYVLTTAHCFFPAGVHKASNYSMAIMGTKFIEFTIPDERIERMGYPIMHPDYKRRGLYNDIALVRLTQPINFTDNANISIARLATDKDDVMIETCYVIGWGNNDTADFAETAQIAKFPLLSVKDCLSNSAHFNSTIELCGGIVNSGVPNTCKGDSGGPLMCLSYRGQNIGPFKQFGVASFKKGICDPKHYAPTYFPKVSYYYPWIQSVIKNNQ